MALIYFDLILQGLRTIEQVPAKWRDAVQELLDNYVPPQPEPIPDYEPLPDPEPEPEPFIEPEPQPEPEPEPEPTPDEPIE